MRNISKSNTFILLVGIAVFSFITVKATISSFTHDESFSYLHYVHTSFMDIISFQGNYTNNHILNSLGMKYSEKLLGSSELVLRLPNLIMFAVYLSYCFLFLRTQKAWIFIGMFVVLSTNTYLIDFFGLARGYGLSIGFMIMSIYHFIQSFHNQKTKNILLFHIASVLAILSSFVLLDVYFLLLIIYNLITYIDCKITSQQKFYWWSVNKIHIIPLLTIAVVLYEPIRKVFLFSRLDFGGKTSFYHDTATYLANYFVNEFPLNSNELSILNAGITCIVLGTTIFISRMIIIRNQSFWRENKALIILNILIVLLVSIITFQHLIFNADYPIARFSIFMLPILMLQFGFLLSFLAKRNYKLVAVSTIIIAFFVSTGLLTRANLRSCYEWE